MGRNDSVILNDIEIAKLALDYGMITPFIDRQVREEGGQKVISYGLSSFGYDIRIGTTFLIFTNVYGSVIDPKNFRADELVKVQVRPHDPVIIPPNSFVLGVSMEHFNIPRDIITICVGKSTYARCGIVVNVTPFEPEWRGQAVIEISNTTPLPARIYACEGIAQVLFFRGRPCLTSYADRDGKYQDQKGIVTALV